jgi:hypothetical protein
MDIACDLNAISEEERPQHVRLARSLFYAGRGEAQELENGYIFRFQPESSTLVELAQFVANERLCCPFWTFTIEVEAGHGPMWIRITGPEGAKALLKAEFEGQEALKAASGEG